MDPASFVAAFLPVVVLGTGAGILTGLSPGLHVNNVAAFVLATENAWVRGLTLVLPMTAGSEDAGTLLAAFVLATAASHAVCDFVPSVFFGVPTEDTALALLPGHRMLIEGDGVRAVALAARGAILGLLVGALVLFPLRLLLADPVDLATHFRPWAPWFLVGTLAALALADARHASRPYRKMVGILGVQGLAGLLGIAALRGSTPIDGSSVLFPLFSGLFGIPNLVLALRASASQVPDQNGRGAPPIGIRDLRLATRGAIAGAAVSWLPGLSGGAASALASLGRRRRMSPSAFMTVLGATSSSTAVLSVAVLFIIGRARSGAAAAVGGLLGDPEPWAFAQVIPNSLLWLLIASALATGIAGWTSVGIARRIAPRLSRIGPRRIALGTLAALVCLIGAATGPWGLAVAAGATVVGLVPVRARVRRVHLMPALLVPVFLYYLFGAG